VFEFFLINKIVDTFAFEILPYVTVTSPKMSCDVKRPGVKVPVFIRKNSNTHLMFSLTL